MLFVIGLVGFIVGIVALVWWNESSNYEKGYSECKDIGGEYLVIDREYSIAYKRKVDVYGCVK